MENFPLGVRRDGSYYTRIEWATHTESDPTFWVCNLIRDDLERNGGTWGCNTRGPATVVLSFFGESQKVEKIRIYRNVGVTISILEELAKTIDIYYTDTDEPKKLRRKEDKLEDVNWTFLKRVDMEKSEGWQEFLREKPIQAKYLRFDLVENFGTPPDIPWVETSEIKVYPSK